MAIKKKNEGTNLPEKLREHLSEAFTLQALKDGYESAYKGKSAEVKKYLNGNDDGFDVSYGKGAGFTCDEGQIIISLGKVYKTDVDKIIELVEGGKITLTSLLGAVTYNQTKLATVLGTQYSAVVEATEKEDITLTLKGDKAFKEKVQAEAFGSEAPEPKAEKPKKPKAKKSKVSSLDKIRNAKKKKSVAADEDLDNILNG
jgi:hypothetical protein